MPSEPLTDAVRTVIALHDAESRGEPLMIPGVGGRRRTAPQPEVPIPASAPVFDRARLEHEWEGGGAPSTRSGLPSWRLMAWLRRSS